MQTYGKEVAKAIIKCRDVEFIVKKNGVFPMDDRPSSASEFDACTWRPACELSGQAGQKLRKKPGLPIPFNANELAAFFLHGWGWYVRDSFGSWDDGPDDAAFGNIDHLDRGELKDAVNGAFHAYRAAERVVGPFDNALALDAQKREDALRSADVSLSKAELRESLRIAYEKANDAESAWRKNMVNQLLTVAQVPLVDSHSEELGPLAPTMAKVMAQTTATPAPVVTASDGHAPLQTHNESAPAQTAPKPDGTDQTEATGGGGDAKPLQRFAAQDNTILSEIRKQGFDPQTLPANLPGKPGVKSATRKALKGNKLFTGSTVFDRAWERLTKQSDIVIKA